MDKAKFLRNVTLLSLAIDSAGFGSIRIHDDDTGDVYTLPCGYVMLTLSDAHDCPHHGAASWSRVQPRPVQ
jgi:hypothetical protein